MKATSVAAVALFVGLFAAGVPATVTFGAEDWAARVQAAKTKADHEALASQYAKQAESAKADAATHRKMGEAYKGQPATSGGKSTGVSAMPQHCDKLAKSFEEQATMYEAMAATERELAK